MDESPEVTTGTDTGAPAETAATQDVDPFDTDAPTFSRDYVARLRSEAAKHRTKANEHEAASKPYQEAFGEYDAEDRAVWFDLAKTYRTDEKAAAERMRQIADRILQSEEPDPEADTPLTRAEFEKRLNEREEIRTQEAVVRSIQSEADALGYTRDTRAYKHLLLTAREETKGDIKAAHELLQREQQSAIDAFIAAKAQEVEGSPVAPGASGSAPSRAKAISSWDDADAAFRAMLDAQKIG